MAGRTRPKVTLGPRGVRYPANPSEAYPSWIAARDRPFILRKRHFAIKKASHRQKRTMILRKLLAAVLLIGVCLADEEQPTVVLAEAVPNEDVVIAPAEPDVAQDRSAIADYDADDQLALESSVVEHAEERVADGGGHHHHHDHGPAAAVVAPPEGFVILDDSFSAPNPGAVGEGDLESAASEDRADSYGAPEEEVEDGYGAPQAPVESYGAPQSPPVYGPPPAPIPVPYPVPVRPGSIVIPKGPPPRKRPSYKPRPPRPPPPPPPKRPSYRPPPPKKPAYKPRPPPPPPPPPPPKYKRPPPTKPVYKPPPKPAYKPRPPPPKPAYKPKPPPPPPPPPPKKPYKPPPPAYGPPSKPAYGPPPKPSYKPRPPPPKPAYKPLPPKPKPKPKPAYGPPRPAYKPRPPPPKPAYKPKPPPPPPPPKPAYKPAPSVQHQASYQQAAAAAADPWPQAQPDMPKITSLDVTCEKNLMKVYVEFDKPFYGIIFSKGHYSDVNCVHLPAGLGRTNAHFDVSINSCGTTGNTENGLYGYGADSGSGTYFENTIVVQYDPQVQEVWDIARKLRCTWHDQYEKSVTFRPFPVDMLDVVRADFAGDNVGCWMQIQVGKGPWASEVSGLVKIGQTMTMVLAIKDDDQKFDMLVRNCMAHDGKRAPIQLVDQKGCVTRPKLMSKFTKIKNFGASASVLSYAHFQAFKFPDSMEVHFQCTIQICRYQCPEQCEQPTKATYAPPVTTESYGAPAAPVYGAPPAKAIRRTRREADAEPGLAEDIGVQKVIQVVSSGDLTFAIKESDNDTIVDLYPPVTQAHTVEEGYICMSTPAFAATLVILLAILVISCLLSAFLCLRHRSYYGDTSLIAAFANPVFAHKKGHF